MLLKRLQATIGVDFALKVLPWDEHTTIRLQVFELYVFESHVLTLHHLLSVCFV
jgi:hypothetical protein